MEFGNRNIAAQSRPLDYGPSLPCKAGSRRPAADVVVQIDKSSQRMAVSVDGTMRYNWPVSTGLSGYGTPSGVFQPQSMARHYFSRKYKCADAARDLLPLWLRHSRHQ
jgi:hypothetical protein